MLPILRIIPMGGVFLAIMILALALNPPGVVRSALPPFAAHGALMAREEHPEWRQFIILAAARRADELARLRELPGMPARSDGTRDLEKFAGLPLGHGDADPNDETGSIADVPAMSMEIGETSSTELPMNVQQEEQPPVVRAPERARAPKDNQTRIKHHFHHAKLKATPEAAPLNLLEVIFGGLQSKQPAPGKQTSRPATSSQN